MQLEQRPPLGYLPNGSTNDFAASLHLHTTVAAARAAAGGVRTRWTLGGTMTATSRMWRPSGAFTRSSYSASQAAKNALGHFAYILEGTGRPGAPCAPTAAPSRRTASASRASSSSGRCATPPPFGRIGEIGCPRGNGRRNAFELLLLRMPKTALDLQNLITAMTRMQYDYPGVIFRHVKKRSADNGPGDLLVAGRRVRRQRSPK